MGLLDALQDDFGGPAAGCGRDDIFQFVARQRERSLLIDAGPVRKGARLDLERDRLVGFIDGVLSKMADRPLNDGLVLLGCALHAIIGCELRSVGTSHYECIVAICLKNYYALGIRAEGWGPLSIWCHRLR